MVRRDGFFEGWDSARLYFRAWEVSRSIASVLIVHGIGEHSGRHENTASYLANKGFSVYAYDQRGHGLSPGKRGHVRAFDEYISDLSRFITRCKTEAGKVFLLGQSFGGLIVLNYAEKGDGRLAGVIASSPAISLGFKLPLHIRLIGWTMSAIMPSFNLEDRNVSAAYLSHDNNIVDRYRGDPLVHYKRSARFFTEFMRAMGRTRARAADITVPCMILQGGEDRIVAARAAADFYRSVGSADKTLKIYDGFYHEVLNEIGKEIPLSEIAEWLTRHV